MALFLTVLTRHMASRPQMFARQQASLDAQTCRDFEQVVILDREGRGMAWAQRELAAAPPLVRGRYVLILDDDDLMHNPEGVALLREAAAGDPPAVICRGDHGEGLGVLPTHCWQQAPALGDIGSFDFILRADVFAAHVGAVTGHYNDDHNLIASVYAAHGEDVAWLDAVVCAVQRRSLGGPGW